jgi:hypothetical protein
MIKAYTKFTAILLVIAFVPFLAYGLARQIRESTDLREDIQRTPLIVHELASYDIYWTYTNIDGSPKDLSGVSEVTFTYAYATGVWREVVTGEVVSATNGQIRVPLRPANLGTNGTFEWLISLSSNGVDFLKEPYGDLWVIPRPGGGSTNPFPTSTQVVDLAGVTFINYPWLLPPAAPTLGTIIYYDGTNWVGLAGGTSGYVLTTRGSTSGPVWTAVGGMESDPIATNWIATNQIMGDVDTTNQVIRDANPANAAINWGTYVLGLNGQDKLNWNNGYWYNNAGAIVGNWNSQSFPVIWTMESNATAGAQIVNYRTLTNAIDTLAGLDGVSAVDNTLTSTNWYLGGPLTRAARSHITQQYLPLFWQEPMMSLARSDAVLGALSYYKPVLAIESALYDFPIVVYTELNADSSNGTNNLFWVGNDQNADGALSMGFADPAGFFDGSFGDHPMLTKYNSGGLHGPFTASSHGGLTVSSGDGGAHEIVSTYSFLINPQLEWTDQPQAQAAFNDYSTMPALYVGMGNVHFASNLVVGGKHDWNDLGTQGQMSNLPKVVGLTCYGDGFFTNIHGGTTYIQIDTSKVAAADIDNWNDAAAGGGGAGIQMGFSVNLGSTTQALTGGFVKEQINFTNTLFDTDSQWNLSTYKAEFLTTTMTGLWRFAAAVRFGNQIDRKYNRGFLYHGTTGVTNEYKIASGTTSLGGSAEHTVGPGAKLLNIATTNDTIWLMATTGDSGDEIAFSVDTFLDGNRIR